MTEDLAAARPPHSPSEERAVDKITPFIFVGERMDLKMHRYNGAGRFISTVCIQSHDAAEEAYQ